MNRLGMIVDFAHADRATTLDACAASTAPVACSHTGARALQEFSRYLGNDEIRAIAATGGLIGLWPFHLGHRGMADASDFARHATHITELVGVEHLCVGTDANGAPTSMASYRGPRDVAVITAGLLRAGFDSGETQATLGGNAAGLLGMVCGRPRDPTGPQP